MRAFITIDTKNNKNGQIYICDVNSIEEAKSWAKLNEDFIAKQKKRRNTREVSLSVKENYQQIHYETL